MMFDISEAQMVWLNVTNIALGAVVLICLVAVSASIFHAVLERRRQRATVISEADRAVQGLLQGDGHAFDVPGLGLTMADGGEPAKPKKNRK
jgi:hypothetical protein